MTWAPRTWSWLLNYLPIDDDNRYCVYWSLPSVASALWTAVNEHAGHGEGDRPLGWAFIWGGCKTAVGGRGISEALRTSVSSLGLAAAGLACMRERVDVYWCVSCFYDCQYPVPVRHCHLASVLFCLFCCRRTLTSLCVFDIQRHSTPSVNKEKALYSCSYFQQILTFSMLTWQTIQWVCKEVIIIAPSTPWMCCYRRPREILMSEI